MDSQPEGNTMNHLYRIVWNTQAACWQAVAEIAKGRGKSTAKSSSPAQNGVVRCESRQAEPHLRGLVLAVAAALLGLSTPSFAGPEGGNVVRGAASISSADKTTTINQSTDRAVINWNRFSVAADEAVRFNQPSNTSATLNRVTGAERSDILGSLSANGHVFLINPNGVLIGAGAQVNVGGFIASSLDMDDEDFMSGKINLSGESEAAVTNEGEITAEEGGTVVLIAPEVNNTGTITANQGSVLLAGTSSLTQGATTPPPAASTGPAPTSALPAESAPATDGTELVTSAAPAPANLTEAATDASNAPVQTAAPEQIVSGGGNTADRFTVRLQDGSAVAFTIDQGAVNAMVNNGGLIQAQGGHIILTAKGRDELSKATVNHSGVIEAQTLTTRNGVVELLADMSVGEVNLSGSINVAAVAPAAPSSPLAASGSPTLAGGFVETSAAKLNIADTARITTAGQVEAGIKAGTWLIDPIDIVIDQPMANVIQSALSTGNVTISTAGTNVPDTSSVQSEGVGDIHVNSNISWNQNDLTLRADKDIWIRGSLTAGGSARLALEYGQSQSDWSSAEASSYTVLGSMIVPDGQFMAKLMTSEQTATWGDIPKFLNNGYLRFGVGEKDSVTPYGTLRQPFYYNSTDKRWYKLTYSNYSLVQNIAVGGNGYADGQTQGIITMASDMAYSYTANDGVEQSFGSAPASPTLPHSIDYSGMTGGTGTAVALNQFEVAGALLQVKNVYTLDAGASFLKVVSEVSNAGDSNATNVRFWSGTNDDWIATTDGPRKQKGNVVDGVFVPVNDFDVPAHAISVTSGSHGVFYLSRTPGVDSTVGSCCSPNFQYGWGYQGSSTYRPLNSPGESVYDIVNDGNYSLFLNIGDLAAGARMSMDWYYSAGAMSQLAEIIQEIDNDSTAPVAAPASEPPPAVLPIPEPVPTPIALPDVLPGLMEDEELPDVLPGLMEDEELPELQQGNPIAVEGDGIQLPPAAQQLSAANTN